MDEIEERHSKKIKELVKHTDIQEEQIKSFKEQEKRLKEQIYGMKDTNIANTKKIYNMYNTDVLSRAERNLSSKRYQDTSRDFEERLTHIEHEITTNNDKKLTKVTSKVRNELLHNYEITIKDLENENHSLIRKLDV